MNKKKIIFYIVFLAFAITSIYVIRETYAVFETDSLGEADLPIGKWVINLNEINISSGQTVNFTMNNFIYDVNSHIKDGYIAPGRTGYFDVVLDPYGTDVSVRYDITLDLTDEYEDNIVYYVTTQDGSTIKTGPSTYSGVLDLDSIEEGETATLRINLEWVDVSTNDDSDTELGIVSNNSISIPATINVIQYFGEELVEYIEE